MRRCRAGSIAVGGGEVGGRRTPAERMVDVFPSSSTSLSRRSCDRDGSHACLASEALAKLTRVPLPSTANNSGSLMKVLKF